MLNYLILVSGRVQGVGFRYFTWQLAKDAGLMGTVRNLDDGRVEIVAQGPAKALRQFLFSIKAGPSPYAKVTKVQVKEQNLADFSSFEITN
ncbi:acylphosphatase [Lactobacillus sp. 3B(2020)]|uniref:acylphosphatase n=1 Tax=Lactobacillus sp. 3B(2020) TaxID=2695882 RepID=UPI0015DEFC95|nr:acylphosphatase [Lactobacillus sp. 3B(2020)]QLL69738.1 acylphosphatase [Lactobacillus sp. 3B(2020)]